jgi:photosystem II stability/assembly factor-like uncharacterized protein
VSHDHGAHFAPYKSPDVGLGCRFDEPAAAVIWAVCATGMAAALTRSSDGGVTFPPFLAGPPILNSAEVAAASATTALVLGGLGFMFLTTDGGQSFHGAGPPLAGGQWLFAGFTDATDGTAIATRVGTGTARVLFRTGDGGQTWSPVAI